MSDLIWGLTTRDIQSAFWNGCSEVGIAFGVTVIAIAAHRVARRFIPNESYQRPGKLKQFFCTVLGIGAGICVGWPAAERLPYVTFAADKAWKFMVISVVGCAIGLSSGPVGFFFATTASGGAFGYFGRNFLRLESACCAVGASIYLSW